MSQLRDLFPGHFDIPDEAVAEMMQSALIVLDANVYLNLHGLIPDAATQHLSALNMVRDRLFVPHQVALEYARNRESTIRKCVEPYQQLEKNLGHVQQFMDHWRAVQGKGGAPSLPKQATWNALDKAFDRFVKEVGRKHDEVRNDYASPQSSHQEHITSQIGALMEGKIGPGYNPSELAKVVAESKKRYAMNIPPGFMDAKNKPDYEAAGDFIIWNQTLEYITSTQEQEVIFVTADQKEDWWEVKRGSRPHQFLVEEMRSKGVSRFYMFDPGDFLRHAKAHLGATVGDETIAQVEAAQYATIDTEESEPELVEIVGRDGVSRRFAARTRRGATIGETIGSMGIGRLAGADLAQNALVSSTLAGIELTGFNERMATLGSAAEAIRAAQMANLADLDDALRESMSIRNTIGAGMGGSVAQAAASLARMTDPIGSMPTVSSMMSGSWSQDMAAAMSPWQEVTRQLGSTFPEGNRVSLDDDQDDHDEEDEKQREENDPESPDEEC
jgi:hypothetical protein